MHIHNGRVRVSYEIFRIITKTGHRECHTKIIWSKKKYTLGQHTKFAVATAVAAENQQHDIAHMYIYMGHAIVWLCAFRAALQTPEDGHQRHIEALFLH